MAAPQELTLAGHQVLDAATSLFYTRGIGVVGVAEIAARAGVSKKTMYEQFGSKDTLIVSYLRARDDRWWARVERRLEVADAGKQRTLVVFDAYLEPPDMEVDRGCVFMNAAAELPADHLGVRLIADHKDRLRHLLKEVIRADRPALGEQDVDGLAEHIFLLIEGANAHMRLGRRDHVDGARRIVASLLAG